MLSDIFRAIGLTLYYTLTEIIVPTIVFIMIITPLLYIIDKVTRNIGVFK